MSFSGWLNDTLTGNPSGTADAASAAGAAADAKNQQINADNLASGLLTQAQYDQTVADFATNAPDPNSLAATAEIAGAAAAGAGGALLHPLNTFANGLNWEAGTLGSFLGWAGNTTSNALLNGLKKLLGNMKFSTFIVFAILIGGGLFLYLGGAGFLARKARSRLSQ